MSAWQQSPQEYLQRMMARKIAAVRADRARLDKIEKNVKHLAKKLGVTLT
jgi:hypothetical protein